MKLTKSILCGFVAASVVVAGCANQQTKTTTPAATKTTAVASDVTDAAARQQVNKALMQLIDSNRFEEAYHWEIPEGIVAGRKAAQEEVARILGTVLVERWSAALIQRMTSTIKTLVSQNEFEKAREILWRIQPTACAAVNAKVDAARAKLMHTDVNVTEWEQLKKTLVEHTEALIAEQKLDEALKYLADIPEIRTYTSLFDKQIDVVCASLVALNIPYKELEPVTAKVRKLIASILADATEEYEAAKVKEAERPDFSRYMSEVNKLRSLLVRYDCPEAKADEIIQAMKDGFAPLISKYCIHKVTPADPTLSSLGTTQVNVKLNALRAEYSDKINTLIVEKALRDNEFEKSLQLARRNQQISTLIQLLIAKTRFHIQNGAWEEARATIRDFERVGDSGVDAAVFAVRVGLLNSEINPAQCSAILKDMDSRYATFAEAGQYREAQEWLSGIGPVRDDYPQIFACLAEIEKLVLEQDAKSSISNVLARVKTSLMGILDRRNGSYEEEKDNTAMLEALDALLQKLETAIVDQTLDTKLAKNQIAQLKKWILESLKRQQPMTTFEMNVKIMEHRNALLEQLEPMVREQILREAAEAYANLLKEMDSEVDFEAQIAIAENAIVRDYENRQARQLHAVLGEYAQIFRLLKAGKLLSAGQKATLAVASVYLNQPQVLDWACKMGADPSQASARDPLKRAPLLVALQTGNTALVRKLAEVGAASSATDANGETALHYAVRLGNRSVIRAVLAANDVNAADAFGWTPLFIAAARNQASLVAFLIEQKADVNATDANDCTALDVACITGGRDVLPLLAEAGAAYGAGDLALAARCDQLAVAQWLVNQGVDVNGEGVMPTTQICCDVSIYGKAIRETLQHLDRTGVLQAIELPPCPAAAEGKKPQEEHKAPELRMTETLKYLVRQGGVLPKVSK